MSRASQSGIRKIAASFRRLIIVSEIAFVGQYYLFDFLLPYIIYRTYAVELKINSIKPLTV
jgi:hypothetical protein